MKTRIVSAAVVIALLAGTGAAMASPRDDAAAALSRLAWDPSAEQPPVLAEMSLREAGFATGQLNQSEIRVLDRLLGSDRLALPRNFEDAIRRRSHKTRGPHR